MPWIGFRMRPTDPQHRDALALHAGRLARYLRGEFPADSWRPVRLSYGLYYQLDHTSHMQRIKLPGGRMTADQLDVLADVTDRYGRGIAHFTTRQDIQIHWVPVAHITDFIPDEDVLVWCEAIVRIQHRYGERKNRSRARMKYVVKKMGIEKFRQAVRDEVARVEVERGDELRTEVRESVAQYRDPAPATARVDAKADPGFTHWAQTNVRPQKQAGYRSVVAQLALGGLTSDQM